MKKIMTLALAVGLLSGCSAKYTTNQVQKNSEQLKKDEPVVISTPIDGVYETHQYTGSGNMTAAAVRAAFLRYSDNVITTQACSDIDCLKEKHKLTQGYYVVPQILHWEDRATQWSGIPDKLEVKVTVYSAKSSDRIASTIISGKSKWMTFGGDHPQDLLPEPVNTYISTLY